MGSRVERTHSKTVAGLPGWARLGLAGNVVASGPSKAADCRLGGPTFA